MVGLQDIRTTTTLGVSTVPIVALMAPLAAILIRAAAQATGLSVRARIILALGVPMVPVSGRVALLGVTRAAVVSAGAASLVAAVPVAAASEAVAVALVEAALAVVGDFMHENYVTLKVEK